MQSSSGAGSGWLEELRLLARTFREKAYPDFVYGAAKTGDDVPVFYYHSVSERELAGDLTYLGRNGYAGLCCDQLVGDTEAGGKEVALTFDDGLASLYDIAFPLLHRFGFRAIAYLVPAYVGRPGFVDWDSCRRMHASGCVDIQAHSWSHSMVVTKLEIVSVWRRRNDRHVPWEVPGVAPGVGESARYLPTLPGIPLYAAEHAYRLPDAFWDDCQAEAARLSERLGAGEELDDALLKSWADRLEDHRRNIVSLDQDALRAAVKADLERCRSVLEKELPGHRVQHFAFPWSRHRPASWSVLAEAGYRSGAIGLGVKEGRRSFILENGVEEIRRVSGDFLQTLPGDRRRSLTSVFAGKTLRRLTDRDYRERDACA